MGRRRRLPRCSGLGCRSAALNPASQFQCPRNPLSFKGPATHFRGVCLHRPAPACVCVCALVWCMTAMLIFARTKLISQGPSGQAPRMESPWPSGPTSIDNAAERPPRSTSENILSSLLSRCTRRPKSPKSHRATHPSTPPPLSANKHSSCITESYPSSCTLARRPPLV